MKRIIVFAILCLTVGCGASKDAVDNIENTPDYKPFMKSGKGSIEMVGAIEGQTGIRLYRFRDTSVDCLVIAGGENRGSVSCVARKAEELK